jgi:hypothetical protein
MTEITNITTVSQDAQDKLLYQFRVAETSPNLMDLIDCIAEEFQEIENVNYSLIVDRYLDNATGPTLELIGENVGMPKPVTGEAATDDEIYRQLIKAKIAENFSEGTTPELLQLLGIFGAVEVFARDIPNAAMQFNIRGNIIAELTYIKDALIRASAPISIDLSTFTDDYFGFEGDARAKGFGLGEIGGTT